MLQIARFLQPEASRPLFYVILRLDVLLLKPLSQWSCNGMLGRRIWFASRCTWSVGPNECARDVLLIVPRHHAALLSFVIQAGARGWDGRACCNTARVGCFANGLCQSTSERSEKTAVRWPGTLFSGAACYKQLATRVAYMRGVQLGLCFPGACSGHRSHILHPPSAAR